MTELMYDAPGASKRDQNAVAHKKVYATQNRSISNHRIVELAEAPRVAAKAIEAAEAPRRLETVEADDGA